MNIVGGSSCKELLSKGFYIGGQRGWPWQDRSKVNTSRNAVSLKGSKLPKLSRLVYAVEVILFYMLEIKRMSGQSL